VGVVCSHMTRWGGRKEREKDKHLFSSCPIMVGLCEKISLLRSVPVISSPASSARPLIVSDWPYLSLTAVATISVGGVKRWQFDESVVSALALMLCVSLSFQCVCVCLSLSSVCVFCLTAAKRGEN